MKKVVCLMLALFVCISLVCPVYASGFKSSPEVDGSDCSNGHNFVNGVCTGCGAVEDSSGCSNGHNFVNGVCTECGTVEGAPETGDNNVLGVWMITMAIAAAGLVVVTCVYRKKFASR